MERYAVKLDRQLTAIKKSQGFGNTLVTLCPATVTPESGGGFIMLEVYNGRQTGANSMDFLNENAAAIGIILTVFGTIGLVALAVLGWYIKSSTSAAVAAGVKPLSDKLDKFTDYERDNFKAHCDMEGHLREYGERITRLEGSERTFSLQLGIAHTAASPPPDQLPKD